MEPTLYNSATMQLKRKMTLDLDTNSVIKKTKSSLHTPSELLQSPDLQLLGIGSPEMERFILQQQNLPTPNLTNVFFPKTVTEEQEVYIKGFTEAYDKVKAQNQLINSGNSNTTFVSTNNVSNSVATAITTLHNNNNYKYEASLTSSPPSIEENSSGSIISEDDDQNSNCYESTGSVGSGSTSGGKVSSSNVPSAPINMENQERIKLERKRQRNRIAASKCRKRKLERISKLEEKVTQLKRENSDLSGVLTKLKEHVNHLKEQIMKHVDCGCNIMVTTSSTVNPPTTNLNQVSIPVTSNTNVQATFA